MSAERPMTVELAVLVVRQRRQQLRLVDRTHCALDAPISGTLPAGTNVVILDPRASPHLTIRGSSISAIMSGIARALRDHLLYRYAYLQGRFHAVPSSFADLYAISMARLTGLLTVPLPFLSFLALPFFGGSSTTINLVFFYLTWSALVLSHGPMTVELTGTLALRLLCFVLPALAFLTFDRGLPQISTGFKAQRSRHLPVHGNRNSILRIAGVSVFNVMLSVLVQGVLESVNVRLLCLPSILRVTSRVPLPWTMATDIFRGLAVRSVVHYLVHRFLLHTHKSRLRTWHLQWQHSVGVPFSLVAAYDHPANFLLKEWLPTFLPAYLFRWHVLTWYLFVAIVSLEELFVYSGYSILPSGIVLTGMARRTEAHFNSVAGGGRVGNFGYLGVIDWIVGSTCKDEVDVLDDVLSEANKHRLQERIEDAVDAALNGVQQKGSSSSKETRAGRLDTNGASGSDLQEDAGGADRSTSTRRRGPLRKARKG